MQAPVVATVVNRFLNSLCTELFLHKWFVEERRGYKPLSLTEILAFTYCMDLKLESVVVALN